VLVEEVGHFLEGNVGVALRDALVEFLDRRQVDLFQHDAVIGRDGDQFRPRAEIVLLPERAGNRDLPFDVTAVTSGESSAMVEPPS